MWDDMIKGGRRKVRNTIFKPIDEDEVWLNASVAQRFLIELLTFSVAVVVVKMPRNSPSEYFLQYTDLVFERLQKTALT